jgi:GR25 family glycosyltransferase involved in LPS biosynthesis
MKTNTLNINTFFDKVYFINLSKDKQRLKHIQQVLNFTQINAKRWNATTPDVFKYIQKDIGIKDTLLACLTSHLTIYNDALVNGYNKILILEDDIIPLLNFQEKFVKFQEDLKNTNNENWDLLYLAYIKTTDDCAYWTYAYDEVKPTIISEHIIKAVNFWSCMAYGINKKAMEEILNWYSKNPPIEIDKYLVNVFQKNENFKSIGIFPQIFAGQDNYSNTAEMPLEIFTRSANPAFLTKNDFYIPNTNTE